MGFYVDTRQHYELRQALITQATMRRAYYGGYPYSDNTLEHYQKDIWKNLMHPTEIREEDWPVYFDNIARILIDNTVNDILPSESMLQIKGVESMEEPARREFYRQLFNFGPAYDQTPAAFISFAKKCLIDVAQPGNGLLFLQLLPTGDKPHIGWQYYPMEGWTVEQHSRGVDPLFYRIEYKYVETDREQSSTYWHRLDIYRDHLVRYADEPALVQEGTGSGYTPTALLPSDTFSGLLPPNMSVLTADDAVEVAEREIMSKLNGWICVPLIWERRDPTDLRGISALRTNQLQSIDQSNRLLTRWGDAAVKHGDPDLMALDIDMNVDDDGDAQQQGETPQSHTDILRGASTGAMQSKFGYPDNLPKELLHKSPMSAIRQSTFEGAPNLTIDAETMATFKDLSGFASGQLNKNHDSRVRQLRDDLVVGGILTALRRALEMLDAAGALPAGIKVDTDISIRVSGRSFSPDEEQKMMGAFGAMQDRGFPPEVLASYAQRFLDIENSDDFVGALKTYEEDHRKMVELAQQTKTEKPTPAKDAPAAGDDGTDNKLK
jgi:hypothetical protein